MGLTLAELDLSPFRLLLLAVLIQLVKYMRLQLLQRIDLHGLNCDVFSLLLQFLFQSLLGLTISSHTVQMVHVLPHRLLLNMLRRLSQSLLWMQRLLLQQLSGLVLVVLSCLFLLHLDINVKFHILIISL